MKLYETITAENWRKGAQPWEPNTGCLLFHLGSLRYGLRDRLDEAAWSLFPERIRPRAFGPGKDGFATVDFNDHPDTTLDDVLRVCKLADV